MGKHTRGPWVVVADERYDPFFCADRIVGYDVKSSTVEVVGSEGISGESEINLANANLIAAAPELLEALECVLTQLESEYMPSDESGAAIVKARAVIAKARGEA